jgi:hypothetical protein
MQPHVVTCLWLHLVCRISKYGSSSKAVAVYTSIHFGLDGKLSISCLEPCVNGKFCAKLDENMSETLQALISDVWK